MNELPLAVTFGERNFLANRTTYRRDNSLADGGFMDSASMTITAIYDAFVQTISLGDVLVIGGGLAGLGGVMLGAASGVQWDLGNILLLLMFAAITVGGLGNPFGALLGAFVIGMFTELWTWVFPNVVELKTLGALITLVVILLVRPQGFLGKKERIG